MTDRSDNDKNRASRSTLTDLHRSWDELLSGFKREDDIEVQSFEDLGLDNYGIDFSSIPDTETQDAPAANSPPPMNDMGQAAAEIFLSSNAGAAAARASDTFRFYRDSMPAVSDIPSFDNKAEDSAPKESAYTHDSESADDSDDMFTAPDGWPSSDWPDNDTSSDKNGSSYDDYDHEFDFMKDDSLQDIKGIESQSEPSRVQTVPEPQKAPQKPAAPAVQDIPYTASAEEGERMYEENEIPETRVNKKKAKKKKKKKKKRFRIIRFLFKLMLLAIIAGVIYVGYVVITSPSIDTSNIYANISQSSVIYDDSGEILESVATSENRTNIDYDQMPQNLINAFVAVEDKTFFTHNGFNIIRIFGAIKEGLFDHKQVGGTSTITQQLARNIYLTQERSFTRKIREAYYTVILERNLSKEQIIEAYLNTINLGYGSYGVQAAAKAYFGCDVQDLTLAECATLATLPKSPSKYAPLKRYEEDKIDTENPNIMLLDSGYVVVYDDTFRSRQELVLKDMFEQGLITQSEYSEALAEDMKADMHPSPMSTSKVSSYFGDYCVSEVIADLVTDLKMEEDDARDLVYSKGVCIYSTLNVDMQQSAEAIFSDTSNFPSVSGLNKESGTGNILGTGGKILLYSKNTYFNDDGSFTLKSDEFERNAAGDLVILSGHRLNIYNVTSSSGNTIPQIEFKNLYVTRDGLFYSINGGYWVGIGEEYITKDSDGNAVISAQFLSDYPDFFTIGSDSVTLSADHYTLNQETIQPQSAMVVTDHSNGQIKVMVGGRSLSGRLLYNRATNPRQPGSSIKPIGVYGPAIQSGMDLGTGWTAGSTIEDAENIVNGKVWPKNAYSGYKGWVTLRTCVEQSINVCSVKLINNIGYDYSASFLKANGISTVVESGNVNDMNPAALGLGGMTKGIAPIEMAGAYGTFPNQGIYTEPCSYTKVTDTKGNIILEKKPYTNRVFDEGVAFIMTDILRTTVTNGIAGRAAISGQPVGGKTGTTSDNMDAWFCGFTPQFAAAVWIGNDVNIELSRGSAAAASLWSKVMTEVCSGYSRGSFPSRPDNVYVGSDGEYYIDGTSKTGPTAGTGAQEEKIEYFTDANGNRYYIVPESGEVVYVDAAGNPIATPDNAVPPSAGDTPVPADNPNGGGQTNEGGNTGGGGNTDTGGGGGNTPEPAPATQPEPAAQPDNNNYVPGLPGVIDDAA